MINLKPIASCTRSVKLSCGATLNQPLIIPAVRVQSTCISTSSNRWQAAQTIRMSSCALCALMLAEHTCSTIRHCCKSWRARKNPWQRLRQSKSMVRNTDSYKQDCTLLRDRNFDVACETGIRDPSYEVMCCLEKMLSRMLVSPMHIFST